MGASLLLPNGDVGDISAPFFFGPKWWAFAASGAAALGLLLSLIRPSWAWLPALAWLGVAAWKFIHLWRSPDAFRPSWAWPVAFVGGGYVLVASLRARRRARPQTDVSAFD